MGLRDVMRLADNASERNVNFQLIISKKNTSFKDFRVTNPLRIR